MSTAGEIARTILELGQIQAEGTNRAAGIRANAQQLAADATARAQANSGQIWGQTIQSLGQIPNQVYGQYQQQQEQKINTQIKQAQLKQLSDAQTAQANANQVISQLPKNPDGTYDTGALLQGLAAKNVPLPDQERFASALDGVNKVIGSFNTSKLNHAADLANAVITGHKTGEPITADSVHLALAAAQQAGIASASDVEQLTKAIDQGADPETVLKTVRGASEKYKTKAPTNEVELALAATGGDPVKAQALARPPQQPTEASLALQAAKGDPDAQAAMSALKPPKEPTPRRAPAVGSFEQFVLTKYGENPTPAQILEARKLYQQSDDRPRVEVTIPGQTASDPKDIADAIISGDQPPNLQGLYRMGGPVRAELARRGYDLTTAQMDWQAIQKHLSTLNGAQQTRLRQATEFVKETVPLVRDLSADLSKKMPRGQVPVLNSVALAAAKNGAFGQEAQAAATTLSAQIADMQSELATMYRGGNASTNEALKKAGDMLKASWSAPQLEAALKLIERNATIRLNSIKNTGVAGVGGAGNQYVPPQAAPQPGGQNDPLGIR